jgi:hypothetical protein
MCNSCIGAKHQVLTVYALNCLLTLYKRLVLFQGRYLIAYRLPIPLSIFFLSALGINSNNSISTKLPVTASSLEIVTVIMVLNYSAFIWGDSP